MINRNILVLCLLCAFSCCHKPNDLERTLIASKDNRRELEKVISHFSQTPADSQELRASKYLIGGLRGFYSYDTTSFNVYRKILNNYQLLPHTIGGTLNLMWDSLKQKYPLPEYVYGRRIADLENVSADFMIADIENVFNRWHNNPRRDSISSADFWAYVLPFRKQSGYALEDWRSLIQTRHQAFWDSLAQQPISEALDSLFTRYADYKLAPTWFADYPMLCWADMERAQSSSCETRCYFNALLLSTLGIPATIDFIPAWGNRNGGHSWNTYRYGGRFRAFDAFWDVFKDNYLPMYNNCMSDTFRFTVSRLPKVFRHTYLLNADGPLVDKRIDRENIPPLLKNPRVMDVSSEYFAVSDVHLSVENKDEPYLYLCVYNDGEWKPVQWSKNSGGKVCFAAMGRDIVYLPAAFRKGRVIPVGDPFLLASSGDIQLLHPPKATESIAVNRTAPGMRWYKSESTRLIGGKLQVAARSDFSDAKTIAVIGDTILTSAIFSFNEQKIRYLRFLFPNYLHEKSPVLGFIGEIAFSDKGQPIKAVKSMASAVFNPQNTARAFDGEPYTSIYQIETTHSKTDNWIGADFGQPIAIDRIELFVKNNDVRLYRGWRYSLFYWDNGWQLLDTKPVGISDSLTFDNVPVGALLLLKCIDKVLVSERLFTYERGKQIFR